jgi:mitochondrial cardiolipin hydrolase
MEKIVHYFTSHFEEVLQQAVSKDIAFQISQLNRQHRSELRDALFEAARSFPGIKEEPRIIDWLQDCFRLIDTHSFRFNKVFFSPGHEIQESVYTLLKDSGSSVYLCVFTITDDRLASEIRACHKRGVKVKLITDDEKINDRGSNIHALKKAGIPVKTDRSRYHMHNKFGIMDGRIVFTGSFNWTYTASRHNQENLLTTSNFDIVQQYQVEFNRLWNAMHWL